MHALMYFKMHHMLLLYLYNISPAGILLPAEGVCVLAFLNTFVAYTVHTDVKYA